LTRAADLKKPLTATAMDEGLGLGRPRRR
jgi:hypothetical protein